MLPFLRLLNPLPALGCLRVDTGNGIVTLVPTVLLSFGATWDVVDPLVLGVVGIVFNYQMAYGTVIYFSNYCYNEYYKGASTAMVWVVILANVIWIVFPGMWMAACWEIIRTGSLGVLR